MTTLEHGYIYIRCHPSYDALNVCKLGKTNNIPDRDALYATCEPIRGHFVSVFQIKHAQMNIVERLLQHAFKKYHYYNGGGVEFYNKKIIHKIEHYLTQFEIPYVKLTPEQVHALTRTQRIRRAFCKVDVYDLIQTLHKLNKHKQPLFKPRQDQLEIIDKSTKYFEDHQKGLLVLMCGVGKTLISLWIAKQMKVNRLLIGVPNTLLLDQWTKNVNCIFNGIPYLIVYGSTSIEHIKKFIRANNKECVIITSYASSYKVNAAVHQLHFTFDMMILDEVHHLTSFTNVDDDNHLTSFTNVDDDNHLTSFTNVDDDNHLTSFTNADDDNHLTSFTNTDDDNLDHHENVINVRKNTIILNVPTHIQLALTATLKIIENKNNQRDDEICISNDNVEYFGEIIDKRSLLWAITQKVVCDYVVQTIVVDDNNILVDEFNINDENDKRLFLAAFVALKSIAEKHSHHLLIYTNSQANAIKVINYLDTLIKHKYFMMDDFYCSEYHSQLRIFEREHILKTFNKSRSGIMSCVYCLGEGWDLPLLDGVVFAENMTSTIRIVQSALRACRKNKHEPDKITKIILPVLNTADWLNTDGLMNNVDLLKIKQVIYQLGLEDETINQKIKAYSIMMTKHIAILPNEYTLNEINEELTNIIKLKTLDRLSLGITYDKAKRILAPLQIKSKNDYLKACDRDVRLPKDPESVFTQFTNWVDYLSIPRIFYELDVCKKKIVKHLPPPELMIGFEYSQIVKSLHDINPKFPPFDIWCDYYEINDIGEMFKQQQTTKVTF
jgi:superfamily II DNA or RNA helicase